MNLIVSYGRRASDDFPTRHACTFDKLHEWLGSMRATTGQKDGPYLVFADFGAEAKADTNPKSETFGQLIVGKRSYSHLELSYAVPVDLDTGDWTAERIAHTLQGYKWLAWTTYKHTPEAPRWRVVVPVARGMTRWEHRATWEQLNAAFCKQADPAAKDATRLNYLPGACLHPEHARLEWSGKDGVLLAPVPAGTRDGASTDRDGAGPVAGYSGPEDDDALVAYMLAYRDPNDAAAMFGGDKPTKIQALLTGDAGVLGALYPPKEHGQSWDHTRADAALANEFLYFTGGDEARSVRLMCASELARRSSWREDKAARAVAVARVGRTQYHFVRAVVPVPAGTAPDADPYATLVDRTDAGNANLLIRLAHGTLRFVSETLQWLYWNAKRWQIDTHEVFVSTRALEVAKHYLNESEKADRDNRTDLKMDYVKWAAKCRNRSTLDNMIALARKSPGVPISVTELDRNPLLLGVENGVVDLRTGELRETESRDDYVTNRCTVRYDAAATCPRWEQFITEITGLPTGDPNSFVPRPAMARYLQKALGYSITGETVEQKLFLAWGEGSNGKNGMFDAVKHLLGGYGRVLPSEALMATARQADSERPTALAATLAGARFVLSSETNDGQTLDVGLIKNHTGDAEMTARRMRENPFTFKITHKLWISTNNKPSLSQVDAAIRGRLHLIPFERKWNRPSEVVRDPTKPDGDKTLPAQLAAEYEGILAWLVRGAVLYQREGLDAPPEVTAFTHAYIAQQDALARWLETTERCEPEQGTGASVLFNLFASWCVDEGMQAKPDNATAFAAALKKLGIGKKHERTGMKYGLRLKPGEV